MNYELALVLPQGTTPAKKKSLEATIESHIKILKGKIVSKDDWGEKDLVYEIKKNKKGKFLIFNINLDKSSAQALNDKLKFEDAIIRYLLIKKNN